MPYKDKIKATKYNTKYHRAYRLAHPEIHKKSQLKYFLADPERRRLQGEKSRERKRLAWAGRPRSPNCEICSRECITVLDHDHKTGKFRGWICNHCNTSLGFARDHIEVFYKMIDYLNRSRGLITINPSELETKK